MSERFVAIDDLADPRVPQLVRVRVVAERADPDRPWELAEPVERAGTAVLVAPGRLLVPANYVADAVPGPSRGRRARIAAVNHDLDLAVLDLENPLDPLCAVDPIELAAELEIHGPATALRLGAPAEPARIEGYITAIRTQRSAHSQRHLPLASFQTDDEVPELEGAVIQEDRLAGLVTQRVTRSEDDGGGTELVELVPAPLIAAFFAGVHAMPALGIEWQTLENPALRRTLWLTDARSGVRVTHVDHEGTCDGTVHPGDVLLAIAGLPVSNYGEVDHLGARVRFDSILAGMRLGDRVRLDLLREGAPFSAEVVLDRWKPFVPRARYDVPPSYVVYGGLVLQPLTRDYLTTWDEWWNKGPKELINAYYTGRRTPERHEMVILSSILEDEINDGYTPFYNEPIVRVDGQPVRDLRQLAAALDAAHEFVTLETGLGAHIVLDTEEVRDARPRILARYGIARDRSRDLEG